MNLGLVAVEATHFVGSRLIDYVELIELEEKVVNSLLFSGPSLDWLVVTVEPQALLQ